MTSSLEAEVLEETGSSSPEKDLDYIKHQIEVNHEVPKDQYEAYMGNQMNKYIERSNFNRKTERDNIILGLYNSGGETGEKLGKLAYYLENEMPELITTEKEHEALLTLREDLCKKANKGYLSKILGGKVATKYKTGEQRAFEIKNKLGDVLDALDDKIRNYNSIGPIPKEFEKRNIPIAKRLKSAKIIPIEPRVDDYLFFPDPLAFKAKKFEFLKPKTDLVSRIGHFFKLKFRKKGQYMFACDEEDIKKEIPAFVKNKFLEVKSYVKNKKGECGIILEAVSLATQDLVRKKYGLATS